MTDKHLEQDQGSPAGDSVGGGWFGKLFGTSSSTAKRTTR